MFNRMEYHRQLLSHDIQQIREKRTTTSVSTPQMPTHTTENRSEIESIPQEMRIPAIQAAPRVRIAWVAEAIERSNAANKPSSTSLPLTERVDSPGSTGSDPAPPNIPMAERVRFRSTNAVILTPCNFRIHVAADHSRSFEAGYGVPDGLSPIKREQASICEIPTRPPMPPAEPWHLRFRIPVVYTIAIVCTATGDANAMTNEWFALEQGVVARRNDKTVEFKGPPETQLSLALVFADQDVRLRLCTSYVIIEENYRFDHNGVASILRNDGEMRKDPEYELMFFDTVFDPMRVRFYEKQAELDRIDGNIVLTEVIRSKPMGLNE